MALKKITDYSLYLLVRLFMCLVQSTSVEKGYTVASFLARLLWTFDKRHVAVARDNLRLAFPDQYSAEELDEIVEKVYVHFAWLLVEVAHIPRKLRQTTFRNYVELRNHERVVDTVLSGRRVILQTAHLGNWEMAGYAMAVFGFRPHSVARALDNPYLERVLRQFRTRTGQQIIYKRGAFDLVSAVMKRGEMVAFLSDQDAGQRGVFVDFFNRPASSHKGVALLALEHDAIICLGFARRLGKKFRYEVWVEGFVDPRDHRTAANPVWSITQACARIVERAVRQAPEQYLWLHRRWKHQPNGGSATVPQPRRAA